MIETGENQVRFWKGDAGHPLKVSINLVELATNLYSDVIDENGTLDIENAFISAPYDDYLDACCELVQVNLEQLNKSQKIAFFLNIYQCMYVHYFLLKVKDEAMDNEYDQSSELPSVCSIHQIIMHS
jgi:hypothetical protein